MQHEKQQQQYVASEKDFNSFLSSIKCAQVFRDLDGMEVNWIQLNTIVWFCEYKEIQIKNISSFIVIST